ncbi:hypothetical protein [Synechococcus sp. W70.1]|uniref:hypothetical protein n=1 Tax=unclassified Synechococcus TaxID=2626047 RepID=UPI0039C2EEC8
MEVDLLSPYQTRQPRVLIVGRDPAGVQAVDWVATALLAKLRAALQWIQGIPLASSS